MVFGFLKKIKDNVVSAAKTVGDGIKSAYKSVASTAKSVYTSVKNGCKKIATKVKKTWDNTPLWGKIAIGAVVGAAIGVGAVVAGPAVLGASALAATVTIGTTGAGGGLIGCLLHSEKAKTDNDQPAPQQRQNRNRNQNEDENEYENRQVRRDNYENILNQNQERDAQIQESDIHSIDIHLDNSGSAPEQHTVGDFTNNDIDLQYALEQSIQRNDDLEQTIVESFLTTNQDHNRASESEDLETAIALSLSTSQQQHKNNQEINPSLPLITQQSHDADIDMAIELSLLDLQQHQQNQQQNIRIKTDNNIESNLPQLNEVLNADDDLNAAIALSLADVQQQPQQSNVDNNKQPNIDRLNELVTADDDLNAAIALSLQDTISTGLKIDDAVIEGLKYNREASVDQVELQTALAESIANYNSDADYQEALAISLLTTMTEQEHEENINIEIATQESIISFLEKFEAETTANCSIHTLIESSNHEAMQTLEGLGDEHRAMQLVREALEELREGKVHQHAERITQALRHFTNAGERLDAAASLKRLNIILQTAKSIIEALIEIEAFDEVVELCTKLKSHFPEFSHLFDNIEDQFQDGEWIGNFDDIVNRNEQTVENGVQLIAVP